MGFLHKLWLKHSGVLRIGLENIGKHLKRRKECKKLNCFNFCAYQLLGLKT